MTFSRPHPRQPAHRDVDALVGPALLYWASAAMVILFAGLIWPVAAFCMAMRPMYEAQHRRGICLFRGGTPGRD